MKPAPFEYHVPRTVDEAVALLHEHGDEGKVIAGGQSLVPLMALRLAQPAHVIDVNHLAGLDRIDDGGDGLRLGATVRQRAAERSPAVARRCPVLAGALPLVAHAPIRNRGTIGGSMAHADPSAELPAVATLLDATFHVVSVRGGRAVPARDFFVTHLSTALEDDELLVEVSLPAWPPGAGWSFVELARRHGDFALVAVAAVARLDGTGALAEVRLALSGVGEVAVRVPDLELDLVGQEPTGATLDEAAERVGAAIDPPDDLHASAAARRQLARTLARRALGEAVARSGGAA